MRRHFEQQRDEYIDQPAQMEEYLEMLDLIDKLTKKNEKLEEETESLQQQLAEGGPEGKRRGRGKKTVSVEVF